MKTFLFGWIALFLSFSAGAQEVAPSLMGKHELSPALSFQHMKEKGSDGNWFVMLPLRWTYFVTGHTGVGAELIGTLFSEGSESSIIFSGIFEYNFNAGKAFPFVMMGAGISNGSYQMDRMAFKVYDKPLGVITVGCGVKAPVSNRVLFRADLQYRNFRGKDTYTDFFDGSETTEKIRVGYIMMSFGISLLL